MTPDLCAASWFKSSFSDNGGECVEITADFPGIVPVRDSKDPSGPALVFSADAWAAFATGVARGDFGGV